MEKPTKEACAVYFYSTCLCMIRYWSLKHLMKCLLDIRKHVSSTFIPMISKYMSEEELSSHVQKQLTIERERYEEPLPEEPSEEEKRKMERRQARQQRKKKHASHHGSILSSSSEVSISVQSEEVEEKDLEKIKLREHARSRMLDDLELLRDYYKQIYSKALTDKVSNQRKQLKERWQKEEERERRKQRKEERKRHKVIIRLPKSEVMNDLSFKQRIPETGYHKIIRLEHQLKKEGYLSKISEIKMFWDYIMTPQNLEKVLEKGQFRWSDILEYEKQQRARSQTPDPETHSQTWAVTNVEELRAANAAMRNWRSTTHPRANLFSPSGLTDISSSRSGRQTSSPSKPKSAKTTTSPSVLTMEQKFPKVEFPPLAAYQLVFGDDEPDPEEVAKEMEQQARLDARRETRRKLITMFSHALANRAATQRLMDRNPEYSFDKHLNTTSVRDIMTRGADSARSRTPLAVEAVDPLTVDPLTVDPLTVAALEAHNQAQLAIESGEGAGYELTHDRGASTSQGSEGQGDNVTERRASPVRLPPVPVPLTMNIVTERFPVQEAKGLSTLWVNPAGKIC
ncbi:calponin homology domain-containing protein DDB_G0272472 isoform X2 [Nematostella vectensis]|uniref:calponin homology domain-containing protein DDB_G0272472 isoform X2 n=1 Tax=Nematostella vectensis TaxID=45351 RepID=UPI0020770D84|nr:calponin homology domain-containing protein DDB_G0272472 isoform X2 [Nematostella vectensis]